MFNLFIYILFTLDFSRCSVLLCVVELFFKLLCAVNMHSCNMLVQCAAQLLHNKKVLELNRLLV